MDDLNCSGEVVRQTLREIEYINKTLGGNEVTLKGLHQLLKNRKGRYTIADLGCGGGEMLAAIHKWGTKRGFDFYLAGFDANPNITAYASGTIDHPNINFITENVASADFHKKQFDIITATLFLHHLSSAQLSALLGQWLQQVKIGIVINDLHRHPLAYHSISLLTKLFSRSPMVKYDAPLSVLRGFSRKEWLEILDNAGIRKYKLHWRWAFRWQLVIWK